MKIGPNVEKIDIIHIRWYLSGCDDLHHLNYTALCGGGLNPITVKRFGAI